MSLEAWITFFVVAAGAVLLTVLIGCVAIMVVKFIADTLAPDTDSGKGLLYRSVRKASQMEAEVTRLEDELEQAKARLAELTP